MQEKMYEFVNMVIDCNMYVFISSDECHEQEELRNSASIQNKHTPILRGNLIRKL